MLRGTLIWLCLFHAAACYRPAATGDCTVRCSTAEDCPAGLQCTAGLCHGATIGSCAELSDARGDGVLDEASVDAPVAPDGSLCYGSGPAVGPFLRICPSGEITATRNYAMISSINTDTVMNCDLVLDQGADQPQLCVVIAVNIVVSARLTAFGSRPLVLLGTNSVIVSGTIDVAADAQTISPSSAPAGSPYKYCATNISGVDTNLPAAGGGGGAGGSFQARGGNGGNGGDGAVTGGAAASAVSVLPSFVRGGCPGGRGGNHGTTAGGRPAFPGGAVYLMSGDSVSVHDGAVVNASGAGGSAPGIRGGGGGGGSGGMIIFDAPSITIESTASVFALGGSGASGGGVGTSGFVGSEPGGPTRFATTPLQPADGGGAGGPGGSPLMGGPGGIGSAPDGGGGGGGGGGGAGGYVVFSSPVTSLPPDTVAPPP